MDFKEMLVDPLVKFFISAFIFILLIVFFGSMLIIKVENNATETTVKEIARIAEADGEVNSTKAQELINRYCGKFNTKSPELIVEIGVNTKFTKLGQSTIITINRELNFFGNNFKVSKSAVATNRGFFGGGYN